MKIKQILIEFFDGCKDTFAKKSSLSTVATTGSYDDLNDKPVIPTKTSDLTNDGDGVNPFITADEVAQSDWEETNSSTPSYIQNKPSIKAGTGTNSIIEGDIENNIASGENSHAEGHNTKTYGEASHAEGYSTQANGMGSHAEGDSTIANGTLQHVFGEYNIEDEFPQWVANTSYVVGDKVSFGDNTYQCIQANNDAIFTTSKWSSLYGKLNYVEIVGNGKDDNTRSNARTLDWDGNETLMGNLTVGGTITANGVPVLPQVQADWEEMDSTASDFIKNKTHYLKTKGDAYSIDDSDYTDFYLYDPDTPGVWFLKFAYYAGVVLESPDDLVNRNFYFHFSNPDVSPNELNVTIETVTTATQGLYYCPISTDTLSTIPICYYCTEQATFDGVTFNPGLYVFSGILLQSVDKFSLSPKILAFKQLDDVFLSDNIMRRSDTAIGNYSFNTDEHCKVIDFCYRMDMSIQNNKVRIEIPDGFIANCISGNSFATILFNTYGSDYNAWTQNAVIEASYVRADDGSVASTQNPISNFNSGSFSVMPFIKSYLELKVDTPAIGNNPYAMFMGTLYCHDES